MRKYFSRENGEYRQVFSSRCGSIFYTYHGGDYLLFGLYVLLIVLSALLFYIYRLGKRVKQLERQIAGIRQEFPEFYCWVRRNLDQRTVSRK